MKKIINQYVGRVQKRNGRSMTCLILETEDNKLWIYEGNTSELIEIDGYDFEIEK